MISVIVPVYKVETYLEQCLDSILCQTYRDLEILLIDDGSPDRCGEICDRYAAADPRIRVFHTENRGLSAARNLGIDHARGEYLGFVDSDDWIEPDMYERLLRAVEENGADIAVCGRVREYPDRKEIILPEAGILDREGAVRAHVKLEIRHAAWDKLYRRACFADIRYPEGRVCEDIATTYRTLLRADKVVKIAAPLYHYRDRAGSITKEKEYRSLVDCFTSCREEYEALLRIPLYGKDREITEKLLAHCAWAALRLWTEYDSAPAEIREAYSGKIKEASRFVRNRCPVFGPKGLPINRRIPVFLCRYPARWSFTAAGILARLYRLLRMKK